MPTKLDSIRIQSSQAKSGNSVVRDVNGSFSARAQSAGDKSLKKKIQLYVNYENPLQVWIKTTSGVVACTTPEPPCP